MARHCLGSGETAKNPIAVVCVKHASFGQPKIGLMALFPILDSNAGTYAIARVKNDRLTFVDASGDLGIEAISTPNGNSAKLCSTIVVDKHRPALAISEQREQRNDKCIVRFP